MQPENRDKRLIRMRKRCTRASPVERVSSSTSSDNTEKTAEDLNQDQNMEAQAEWTGEEVVLPLAAEVAGMNGDTKTSPK